MIAAGAYDFAMGLHDELQDAPPDLVCCRCERIAEPIEMQKCPSCHKMYCNYCIFRMGGAEYCSRQCGEAMFFGNPDSEDGFPEDAE